MSLRPEDHSGIPQDTKEIGEKILSKKHPYRVLRESLGELYRDADFADLFDRRGPVAISPGQLAMVLVLQYAEDLSDREAANAVAARIDWKYLLGLPLADAGFDHSVLSEFRKRLIAGSAENRLLEKLLEQFKARGVLKKGKQRTDSTHVLDSVRTLSRLELVRETLMNALEFLAEAVPDWLVKRIDGRWIEAYVGRSDEWHLPKGEKARAELAKQIGADGAYLLNEIDNDPALTCLKDARAIEALRKIWEQQYVKDDESGPNSMLRMRTTSELPAGADLIQSPYDMETRWSIKHGKAWIGYKVHFTETCVDGELNVITHVLTTPATTGDVEVIGQIESDLEARGLKPEEHYVDAGYTSASHIVEARKNGIELIGPVHSDHTRQGRKHPEFALANFPIDWENRVATCPEGQHSTQWRVSSRDGHVDVRFNPKACTTCAHRAKCVNGDAPARTLRLKERMAFEILQNARKLQMTAAFLDRYKRRAGIEALFSQTTRRSGLRESRYIGQVKTHLQMTVTAVATNLVRLAAALAEAMEPRAKRRPSVLLALSGLT